MKMAKKKLHVFYTFNIRTRQLEMPIRRKPGVGSKCKLHKPKVLR